MPLTRTRTNTLFEKDPAAAAPKFATADDNAALEMIDALNTTCEARFREMLIPQDNLSRSLVSFQANKERPFYRWFKYKEAFSAELVEHMLAECGVTSGVLFDPFAGIGTALFAAGELGLRAEGIELLPIGQRVITTKQVIDWDVTNSDIKTLSRWLNDRLTSHFVPVWLSMNSRTSTAFVRYSLIRTIVMPVSLP